MNTCFAYILFLLTCLLAKTHWTHTRIFTVELVELENSGVSGEITMLSARSSHAGTTVVGGMRFRGLKASLTQDDCGGLGKAKISDFCRTYLLKGSACTNEASQGGRDQEGTGNDPWRTTGFGFTDESGMAEVYFSFGRYPEADSDFAGKPFIVHDEHGKRVACGLVRQAGLPVFTAKVMQYDLPTTPGKLPVEGEVMIVASNEGVLGIAGLRNVEEGIAGKFFPVLSKEATCTDVKKKTPKQLEQFSSYWQPTSSSTTGKTRPAACGFTQPLSLFESEGDLLAIEGKRVIIYGANGSPWSCGVLACSYWPVYTASLSPLRPSSHVSGTVTIATTRTSVLGVGTGTNLENGLRSKSDGGQDCQAGNECGAHVHNGKACFDMESRSSPELQGGHYFSAETDPWVSVGYLSTDSTGNAFFHFNVKSIAVKIVGKPFILHDKSGARVACGILELSLTSQVYNAALEALPDGKQLVGQVSLLALPTGVIGLGSVRGLKADLEEKDCSADSVTSCGAILHDGKSCKDESAWGKPASALSGLKWAGERAGWLSQEPWKSSRYIKTDSDGDASFDVALTVGQVQFAGKAFVVHDAEGTGISCGILSLPEAIVKGSIKTSSNTGIKIFLVLVVLLVACVGGVLVRRTFFKPTFATDTSSRTVSMALKKEESLEETIEMTPKTVSSATSLKWSF